MTNRKQWRICQDSLEPLADKLWLLTSRFGVFYDFDALDQLNNEYRTIRKVSPHSEHLLTDAQRARLAELSKLISAWKEPPCPRDVENLYEEHRIDRAIEGLKALISVDYADDFSTTLQIAKKRFSALNFKACKILNGDDVGDESIVWIRYAIPRLIDWYFEQLHAAFPGRDDQPTGDELPDDLRKIEVEIVDEYEFVQQEIRKVAKYLGTVAALIRGRVATAATSPATMPTKAKRSTKRSTKGSEELIISALTSRHKYADGCCLNLEPVGNNELARFLDINQSTMSTFFKDKFGGHAAYETQCGDAATLGNALRLLNGEITPAILNERRGQKRVDPDTLHSDRKRSDLDTPSDAQKRIDERIDGDTL